MLSMNGFIPKAAAAMAFGASLCLAGCAQIDAGLLFGPTQAVLGPDGLLYVADGYYNSRVAVYDTTGTFIREFGRPGFGRGEFHTPHSIALGQNGLLYVADRGNARVQAFSGAGQYVTEWNDPQLGHVFSVAVSPTGKFFAADGGTQVSKANRAGIVEIDSNGRIVQKVGSPGTAVGEFDEPHMLAVADDNTVYVAEIGNRRVQKLNRMLCADLICPFAPDSSWPSAPTRSAIGEPLSVALASAGKIWVGFTNGTPGVALLSPGNGEIQAIIRHPKLQRPHGISTDSYGRTWVADNETNRVFRIANDQTIEQVIGK